LPRYTTYVEISEAKNRHSDPMNVQIASLRLSIPVEVGTT
jgi:hypothetical protein